MTAENSRFLKETFKIDDAIISLADEVLLEAAEEFSRAEEIAELNQAKILRAFRENHVREAHFAATSGYGYGDLGRDTLDRIFAEVFGGESAIVRSNIACGTQAISLCLFGVLRPGDTLLAVAGRPYDTLLGVIGIDGKTLGSLADFGVNYAEIPLDKNNLPDYANIAETTARIRPKAAFVARSKGYEFRESLGIREIEKIIKTIKTASSQTVCVIDNCYGEFVENLEPPDVGADLCAGSLIKNPGGGVAEAGGYVVGKKELVELAASSLTAPGLGSHVGPSLGQNKLLYKGIFAAPHAVCEAMKTAIFASRLFDKLGFETCPKPGAQRFDTVQAIKFESAEKLIKFCQAIQNNSPVDSDVTLEPWDMPGYSCKIVMASGGFTQGSSIELSADAPIREPYVAYLQGGVIFSAAKIAIMKAASDIF
jgi:cystathionine beta-lyase family protein involved in aluminum resistance